MDKSRKRPLKVGLYIPNGDGMMGGGNERWTDVLALAAHAEAVGFDSIWVADHLIFEFEGHPRQGRWECWSLLAALAATTTRVELGPLVSCMSFRNPALLAKIAETVDEISNGRLILGLGAGWHEPEYRAYGYPLDRRASRFDDGIQIIHGLLRDGTVDFDGAFAQAHNCELRPRGPRPARLPIMIGTHSERMLRLTARYADIWNTTWIQGPDELPPLRVAVDAACDEVGRDPATLERTACVLVDLPARVGRSPEGNLTQPRAFATEEIVELLHGVAGEGITHAQVWLDPSTIAGVDAFAPVLHALDS